MHFRLISDLDESSCVDLQDRAFHYGDGLFETLLLENGELRFWPAHYQRLSESAQRLLIACPDKLWFEHELQPYIALKKRLVIKILLSRGSGGRGIQLPKKDSSNVYLLHYNADNIVLNQSIKAIFSEITLPENQNLAGIKHLNRLDYTLAAASLQQYPTFDEALLMDKHGHVIEGIIHNLFFVRDGIFYTADLSRCGVNGVMRRIILKKLKQMGKKVKIGDYLRSDVLAADECFVCNSVQGIRPLNAIGKQIFKHGENTRLLQQQIETDEGD